MSRPDLQFPLRLGELFCGPGGLARGAMAARANPDDPAPGFLHAWANDLDPDACATFVRNICPEGGHVLCGDVRKLDLSLLPPIDCLAFGFPCNDYSVVGEQKGMAGHFGPLYTYGVAVLNQQSPACFVAENVSGLSSANEGAAFAKIVSELRASGGGYQITAHLYKAEEYGVPQKRRRILLVGIRDDLGRPFRVPAPTTRERPPTVRTALIDRPIPAGAANHELTVQSAQVVERLEHIRPGQNAFNATIPDHLKLQVKGAKISQIYRRLHPDEPSYTITGSGGGGTHVYHWEEPRALTNRERARLQGFPDDHFFVGRKESVRKQVGMAVPPPLARAVFEAILKTLLDVPYDSVEANMLEPNEAQPHFIFEKKRAYRKVV